MQQLFIRLRAFCKAEAVLVIAFVCAAVSACFVPPDAGYATYIDVRVLCLLFCLMTVVAGFQECGLFVVLAERLLTGRRSFRLLCLALVLLPFFLSMLMTNDVALITFVPFALLVLGLIGRPERIVLIVVLQTVAANLGSMFTPVGNPQNLFLYARFGIAPGEFFGAMLPFTAISLVGLTAAAFFLVHDEMIEVRFPEPQKLRSKKLLVLFSILFLFCLLTVFHLMNDWVLVGIVLVCLLVFAPKLIARADYGLLATFACFFVFAGNIGRIEPVRLFLAGLLAKSTAMTAVLASQIISNVPAAVLLAGFTDNWKGLLVGTNIGGLGTLIASLASLISFKYYLHTPQAKPLRYLGVFTLANVAGLAVLLAVAGIYA